MLIAKRKEGKGSISVASDPKMCGGCCAKRSCFSEKGCFGNINLNFVLTTRNPIKGQQLLAVFELCRGESLVFHTVVAKAMVKAPSLL